MYKLLFIGLPLLLLAGCGFGYASDLPEPSDPDKDYLDNINAHLKELYFHIELADSQPKQSADALQDVIDSLYAIEPPPAFKGAHDTLMRSLTLYAKGVSYLRDGRTESAHDAFTEAQLMHESFYQEVTGIYDNQ